MLRSLAVLLGLSIACAVAHAAECPQGAPSCKVVVITPQEEQVLLQRNGILDSAEQARFLDLSAYVKYFRDRIANAPAGEVKKPEEKKE